MIAADAKLLVIDDMAGVLPALAPSPDGA